MKLKPIRRPRLSQSAVNQIRDYIRSEKLAPGTKLPSERKLMDELEISRNSIREALRILEVMGLVEVKPGKGSFVCEPEGKTGFSADKLFSAIGSESIHNIFEARLLFEPSVARMAAERATAKEIREIEDLFEEMRDKLREGDMAGAIIADAESHKALARITRNSTLSLFMDIINRALFDEWEASLEVPSRMQFTVEEHSRIVKCLRNRDGAGAEEAMREHLLSADGRYKEKDIDPRGKKVAGG